MNDAQKEVAESLSQERLHLSLVEKMIGKLGIKSAEVTLAGRAAQLAKMYLGKAKGYAGADDPYPESRNTDNKVIAPTAPDFENKEEVKMSDDPITNVKAIRNELATLERLVSSDLSTFPANRKYQLAIEWALAQVLKSGFMLGLVLGQIRDEAEKADKAKKADALKLKKENDKKAVDALLSELQKLGVEVKNPKKATVKSLKKLMDEKAEIGDKPTSIDKDNKLKTE